MGLVVFVRFVVSWFKKVLSVILRLKASRIIISIITRTLLRAKGLLGLGLCK